MKVLILCNNAFVKGNGLCTAIQSVLSRLRENGIEARLMAADNADSDGDQPDYPLRHFTFPFFEPLIYANGFRFARFNKKEVTEAISWADIVHIEEAFPLQIYALKIARKLGKPVVGTFHLFPENITANLGIAKIKFISDLILYAWRDWVFDKCTHIQCPTELVKKHLEQYGFKSELRVVSNGIDFPVSIPVPVSAQVPSSEASASNPPYRILCIGRLSNEKSQKTLLDAMRYSAHASEIQLEFAGNGPYLKKYKKISDRLVADGVLRYRPHFGFYDKEGLAQLTVKAYLYIHCAWVEVEGLSCVEALRYGVVPIIAEGPLSATSQFALDSRSTFPVFDAKALASRIDWWIEHPEERDRMSAAYKDSVSRYDQKRCTLELIQMYRDAIG